MNKLFISVIIALCFTFCACNSNSTNDSIIGTWTECRANGDDYGLSSWKFNSDGSGIFSVQGYTNKEQIAFIWEANGNNIEVNMNGEYQTLELNNGLLIETTNSIGTIVFKKQ